MAMTPSTTHANVRRYRERVRAKGFRQFQLRVPDTRSPEFAEECRPPADQLGRSRDP